MLSFGALAITAAAVAGDTITVSVFPTKDGFSVKQGIDKSAAAQVIFEDTLLKTGWGKLDIKTNKEFSDELQMKSAGVGEGYVTASHIATLYANMLPITFQSGGPSKEVTRFLDTQEAWTKEQIAAHASDNYWGMVGGIVAQFDGLVEGYELARKANDAIPQLPRFAFQMLNAIGDLFQIKPAVNPSLRPDFSKMTKDEMQEFMFKNGHCSGLVKVTGAFEDLFMAHVAWFEYANTDRIFKHYNFDLQNPATAAKRVSFSSYPGYLESLDDFYMMPDSGLGMVQTSNNVMNNSLYSLIKPQSLLAWQRVRLASAMAHDGEEWYTTFKKEASGTYVNQYMVVDFNKFTPGHALGKGTLWVVEEIPGLVAGADMTETLTRGYWPSYNVPYFPEVYKRSGYDSQDVKSKLGTDAEYELAPRAKIFRRDEATVVDMTSLKRIMRYNNYHNDPYSFDGEKQNPNYAICARGDLSTRQRAGGCYDGKVTSYLHGFYNASADVVNGPSTGDSTYGELPPFRWTGHFANMTHEGLPPVYNFPWVKTAPTSEL